MNSSTWNKYFLCFIVYLLGIVDSSNSKNILAIIHTPSYSHQIPYQPLWKSLSLRGHKVVTLTTDPINDPTLINLTEIDLGHNYVPFKKLNFLKYKLDGMKWREVVCKHFWEIGHNVTHDIFNNSEVKKMYAPDSKVKFDLIIVENLLSPACYIFSHRFDAPLIGVSTVGLTTYNQYLLGGSIIPSHPSTWENGDRTGFNLPFHQRVENYLRTWWYLYRYTTDFISKQQAIVEQYFGPNSPGIGDLAKNMSLVFVNQQEAISFVRPNLPNVLTFGGFHIKEKLVPFDKDLESFIDNATEGFIYVSLGTNVKISALPKRYLQILIEIFSNLPCRVIWKCEVDFPNNHSNIFIRDWFPQQSILAHPKIRLFFYQGGLQSTEEAVHFAVPLIGMPILADQDYNVYKMVDLGVARRVNLATLTKNDLEMAIHDVLNDTRYKERMLAVRDIIKEKPYNSLDQVIWWTEFVINHKGAPHLRYRLVQESWYQKYDMDILAFLSISLFILLLMVFIIIYRVVKRLIQFLVYIPSTKITKKKFN